MIRGRELTVGPGGAMLALLLVGLLVLIGLNILAGATFPPLLILLIPLLIANIICLFGLFIVNPNEAKVLQLFGRYIGTVREPGLKWANPFYTKRKISVRIRNFESNKLKV